MSDLTTTITSEEYRALVEEHAKCAELRSKLFSEQISHGDTKNKLEGAQKELDSLAIRVEQLEAFVAANPARKLNFEKFVAAGTAEVSHDGE